MTNYILKFYDVDYIKFILYKDHRVCVGQLETLAFQRIPTNLFIIQFFYVIEIG